MRKLWKPALLLATVGVLAFGLLSSGAWFTSQDSSSTATFTSGTLIVDIQEPQPVQIASFSNMAPGDLTEDVVIIIKNNGTLPLAWFGDLVVSDNVLKDAIYIDYAKMEFLTPGGQTWYHDNSDNETPGEDTYDNFVTNGRGSGPYGSWYTDLADDSPFHVLTLGEFDGTNGMGSLPFEFMGALNPQYYYKLTLRFGMASGAENEYQDKGPLEVSFYVRSTQVKEGALNAQQPGWGTHLSWLEAQIADQTEP